MLIFALTKRMKGKSDNFPTLPRTQLPPELIFSTIYQVVIIVKDIIINQHLVSVVGGLMVKSVLLDIQK